VELKSLDGDKEIDLKLTEVDRIIFGGPVPKQKAAPNESSIEDSYLNPSNVSAYNPDSFLDQQIDVSLLK